MGIWSMFAARIVGRQGRVVAFEPSAAYAHLVNNTRHQKQIDVFRLAVGAEDRETEFFAHGDAPYGSVVPAVTSINRLHAPQVPVTT